MIDIYNEYNTIESLTAVTVTVAIQSGVGSVDVYRNGTFVQNVTSSQSISFNTGDTFQFIAKPSSGYTFQKFCGDTACSITSTSSTFAGTITSNGYVYAYFVGGESSISQTTILIVGVAFLALMMLRKK